YRDKRLRNAERRCRVRTGEVGQRVEGISISPFDLRCPGLRAERRHRTWMGGRRSAPPGEGGVLSERTRCGGAPVTVEPGGIGWQRRREKRIGCGIRAPEVCALPGFRAAGDKIVCLRSESE